MERITKQTFIPTMGEYNSPKFGVFVETATYVPAKSMIESLMLAGERLRCARAENYDSDEVEPDFGFDTSVRDFELSEIGSAISHGALNPQPISQQTVVPESVPSEASAEAQIQS
ncbi:hypothetical protein [Capybara microvirus Cap3_SP_539]|nr:hypothetical protein [Capybara microvirus Cap3_SP_539]